MLKTDRKEHFIHMAQHRTGRRISNTVNGHALESLPFAYARQSIACERHPERNEDSLIVDERSGLVAVFDGVGGSAAGEIASQTAARAALNAWKQEIQRVQKRRKVPTYFDSSDDIDLPTILQQLIEDADKLVRTEGAQRAGTDDLATTVALAAFSRDSSSRSYTMTFAHVGDSRIYLLRKNEALKRLTNDDGLLARLVDNQIISDEDALRIDQAMQASDLSDIEFSYFRLRGGITQALGSPLAPTIHINQVAIYPGDRILLCTDGIHDNLIDTEIEDILRRSVRSSAARLLVERALERSHEERETTIRAKPDDITAIVVTCCF